MNSSQIPCSAACLSHQMYIFSQITSQSISQQMDTNCMRPCQVPSGDLLCYISPPAVCLCGGAAAVIINTLQKIYWQYHWRPAVFKRLCWSSYAICVWWQTQVTWLGRGHACGEWVVSSSGGVGTLASVTVTVSHDGLYMCAHTPPPHSSLASGKNSPPWIKGVPPTACHCSRVPCCGSHCL